MTAPGQRSDFSAARRQDGQLRRTVVENHVGNCFDCAPYEIAVKSPELVLAGLATVPLSRRLSWWGEGGLRRTLANELST
jgi:hypothetical protein